MYNISAAVAVSLFLKVQVVDWMRVEFSAKMAAVAISGQKVEPGYSTIWGKPLCMLIPLCYNEFAALTPQCQHCTLNFKSNASLHDDSPSPVSSPEGQRHISVHSNETSNKTQLVGPVLRLFLPSSFQPFAVQEASKLCFATGRKKEYCISPLLLSSTCVPQP